MILPGALARATGLLALVALLIGTTPARADAPERLTVVSFNAFHGGAASGLWGDGRRLDRRVTLALEALRALDPDVVALQEASAGLGRGNVASRLAAALGLQHVWAPATSRALTPPFGRLLTWVMNFAEGPAVLSRFPIAASEIHELPRCGTARFDPRVALIVGLDTPWGRLPVLSTHTSRDACQIRRVGELALGLRGETPALVMGDLNTVESAEPIAALAREGLVDAFRTANPTEPGLTVWQRVDAPGATVFRRVDYVFIVPGRAVAARVRTGRVVLNTPAREPDGTTLWPSDHYGVLVELELVRR